MKRYADIAHYRAPYKDVMLSGFGADEAPAAAPATYSTTVTMSPNMSIAYSILFAYSAADKDGLAVLKPEGVDFVLTAAATLKGLYQGGAVMRGGAVVQVGAVVYPAEGADYGSKAIAEPSMLDYAAALTGRGAAPKGQKIAANDKAYVLVSYGENAQGKVLPVFTLATKEQALAMAPHRAKPTYFVLLAPGQKLSSKVESLLKYPAGLSTAAMLGYGALGLAAAAGLFMLLGGKKKKASFEANPKRKKKARKAKRAKKAAHKVRRPRRARKARRAR